MSTYTAGLPLILSSARASCSAIFLARAAVPVAAVAGEPRGQLWLGEGCKRPPESAFTVWNIMATLQCCSTPLSRHQVSGCDANPTIDRPGWCASWQTLLPYAIIAGHVISSDAWQFLIITCHFALYLCCALHPSPDLAVWAPPLIVRPLSAGFTLPLVAVDLRPEPLHAPHLYAAAAVAASAAASHRPIGG